MLCSPRPKTFESKQGRRTQHSREDRQVRIAKRKPNSWARHEPMIRQNGRINNPNHLQKKSFGTRGDRSTLILDGQIRARTKAPKPHGTAKFLVNFGSQFRQRGADRTNSSGRRETSLHEQPTFARRTSHLTRRRAFPRTPFAWTPRAVDGLHRLTNKSRSSNRPDVRSCGNRTSSRPRWARSPRRENLFETPFPIAKPASEGAAQRDNLLRNATDSRSSKASGLGPTEAELHPPSASHFPSSPEPHRADRHPGEIRLLLAFDGALLAATRKRHILRAGSSLPAHPKGSQREKERARKPPTDNP